MNKNEKSFFQSTPDYEHFVEKFFSFFFKNLLTNSYKGDKIVPSRGKENPTQKTHDRKAIMFYWFTFADGYRICTRGFDRVERMHAELAHGKIVSKVKA